MSIILQSSSGGSVTINEPATASNFTQTLPAATGTVMVSGNQPAFSAWQSTSQTLPTTTATKLQFQTEEFDTANCFDNATNFRFTPNVAGYYQVNACFNVASIYTTGYCAIYKNGTSYKLGNQNFGSGAGLTSGWSVSCVVYLNGTTDYIEAYAAVTNGQALANSSSVTYFQAAMIRSA
jgi:hypothetical protein